VSKVSGSKSAKRVGLGSVLETRMLYKNVVCYVRKGRSMKKVKNEGLSRVGTNLVCGEVTLKEEEAEEEERREGKEKVRRKKKEEASGLFLPPPPVLCT